jgi:hypothetical protein
MCVIIEKFEALIASLFLTYSSDQNGSRFIQQKLENCTTEEKALLFAKILPHTSSLMTDVFGNYVIQKVRCSFFICVISAKLFMKCIELA